MGKGRKRRRAPNEPLVKLWAFVGPNPKTSDYHRIVDGYRPLVDEFIDRGRAVAQDEMRELAKKQNIPDLNTILDGMKSPWTPQNLNELHISIAFLGEVPASQVSSIKKIFREAVKDIKPREVRFDGIGTFGTFIYPGYEANPKRKTKPTVLVAMLNTVGVQLCRSIHRTLAGHLKHYGFSYGYEPHAFNPHATLGVGPGEYLKDIENFAHEHEDVQSESFMVDHIFLATTLPHTHDDHPDNLKGGINPDNKGQPFQRGSRYRILDAIPLGL